jgi:hypothetical protein
MHRRGAGGLLARVGDVAPGVVNRHQEWRLTLLPIEMSMPLAPQSPIPRISSASVATAGSKLAARPQGEVAEWLKALAC